MTDESWQLGADVDVFSIALHEAGHALGLGHSDNPNAVMYPYYRMHSALDAEDIAAIRKLYAAQDAAPDPGDARARAADDSDAEPRTGPTAATRGAVSARHSNATGLDHRIVDRAQRHCRRRIGEPRR